MRLLFTILLLFACMLSKGQMAWLWAMNKAPAEDFVLPTGTIAMYRSDSGVTTSSGQVTQWNDLSGNGRHLLSVGSTPKPFLTTNQINGKPAVEATAAGQILQTTVNFPSMTGLTIYAVMKVSNATGSYGRVLSIADYDNGAWIGREVNPNSNMVGAAKAANPPYGSIVSTTFGTWKLVKLTWNGSSSVLTWGTTTGASYSSSGATTAGPLTLYARPALTTPAIASTAWLLIIDHQTDSTEDTYIKGFINNLYFP